MKSAVGIAFILALAVSRAQEQAGKTLSDADILSYASQPYDKREMTFKHIMLGVYRGVPVVVDFPCSDLCPAYTTRVIRYDVPVSGCSAVGGVVQKMLVPYGIASQLRPFCVPKVLADNFNRFRR